MERTKRVQHITSLTILKLRISNPIIRILSTLVSFCSHATSIKMELEYPTAETIQYELMHNRASFNNNDNNADDAGDTHDDFDSLMVTEENANKYFRQLFHTLSHLPNLEVLFLRLIDFPLSVYKDYITMCYDLEATNYKSFPSLKSLTFPIDHNSIQVELCPFIHTHTRDHMNKGLLSSRILAAVQTLHARASFTTIHVVIGWRYEPKRRCTAS